MGVVRTVVSGGAVDRPRWSDGFIGWKRSQGNLLLGAAVETGDSGQVGTSGIGRNIFLKRLQITSIQYISMMVGLWAGLPAMPSNSTITPSVTHDVAGSRTWSDSLCGSGDVVSSRPVHHGRPITTANGGLLQILLLHLAWKGWLNSGSGVGLVWSSARPMVNAELLFTSTHSTEAEKSSIRPSTGTHALHGSLRLA
ncbi:hypothetical protein PO909_003416 [Leuciscus waleckii]